MSFAFNLNLIVSSESRLSLRGELTMAWYHDEANKQNAIDQEKARQKYVIRQSTFWAALKGQIETDVDGINHTAVWTKRLGAHPLIVESPSDGNGYSIRKPGSPAVIITLWNRGDHIEVKREFIDDPTNQRPSETETLDVGVTAEERICLISNNRKRFMVPEVAAEYILTPIIESLKVTK